MLVRMIKTAAGPKAIHHAGRVYNLDNETARNYLADHACERVHGTVKADRVPHTPDPEDVPDGIEADDDDEAEG